MSDFPLAYILSGAFTQEQLDNWTTGDQSMNAQEAKKATVAAQRRREAASKRLATMKANKEKAEIKKALKEVPWYVEEIRKRIKKVTKSGGSRTDWEFSATPVGSALYEAVEKVFQKEGYKTSYRFARHDDDYGDFNAPCRVYSEGYELNISWEN